LYETNRRAVSAADRPHARPAWHREPLETFRHRCEYRHPHFKGIRLSAYGSSMLRAAFVLIALLFSTVASAEWVRVGGNNNVGVYADPASISKKGHIATMTSLLNYTRVQTDRSIGKKPYLSQKDTREYDCVNERHRLVRFSLRSQFMFAGELVRSNADDGEWRAVEPDSLGAALWKFACGKK
jgi:hypothetical protein